MLNVPKDIYKLPKNSFIVGGAVRDIVQGVTPADIDITTELLPEELLELYPNAITLGIKFGTVIVNGVEITTMRKDMTSGRHPNVSYTTDLFTDLSRRDFKMNAMAIPLHGTHTTNNIIDPYGGIEDMKKSILSCVGDAKDRIVEDPLRSLRAVRFSAKYDYRMTNELFGAIHTTSIAEVSNERIKDELVKAFMYNSVRTIGKMYDYGLLTQILPEISELTNCEHSIEYHPEGNAYNHTVKALEFADANEYTVMQKFAVLFHDVGKGIQHPSYGHMLYPGHANEGAKIAKDILQRLKFSNNEQAEIIFAIKNHMKMHNLTDMRKSKRYALYRNEYFNTLLKVHDADCMDRRDSNMQYAGLEISMMPPDIKCFMSGGDLLNMGYPPSKFLGDTLKDIFQMQIDGDILNKDEAYLYASYVIDSEEM